MSWSREAGSPAFLDQEQHGLLGLSPALLPREPVGCTVPRKQEAVPLPNEHSCSGGLCSWSVPRPLCRFCGQGLGAPLLAPSQPSVRLRVSASRGRLPPLHPQHPLRERAGGPQVLVAACESHQDPRPPRRASLGTAGAHRHPCLPQLALHASVRRLAPFAPLCLWPCLCPLSPGLSWEPAPAPGSCSLFSSSGSCRRRRSERPSSTQTEPSTSSQAEQRARPSLGWTGAGVPWPP